MGSIGADRKIAVNGRRMSVWERNKGRQRREGEQIERARR